MIINYIDLYGWRGRYTTQETGIAKSNRTAQNNCNQVARNANFHYFIYMEISQLIHFDMRCWVFAAALRIAVAQTPSDASLVQFLATCRSSGKNKEATISHLTCMCYKEAVSFPLVPPIVHTLLCWWIGDEAKESLLLVVRLSTSSCSLISSSLRVLQQ